MSNNNKKTFLEFIEENKYVNGIRIPSIQRDYVLGSSKKLKLLLHDIYENAEKNKSFDLSCIIINKEHEKLEIYDGQQRLVTLTFMYLYYIQKEKKESKFGKDWLEFSERPFANEVFNEMVEKKYINFENLDFDLLVQKDCTSFAINQLLKKINEYDKKYNNTMKSDYILNNIQFGVILIEKQSEAEQFFMDLNSGIKLKEFEIYKSKLNDVIKKLSTNDNFKNEKSIENWSSKIDNEWLNFFRKIGVGCFEHTEEEYEIRFIRYCLHMAIEEKYIKEKYTKQINNELAEEIKKMQNENYIFDNIDSYINNKSEINKKIIHKIYEIIHRVYHIMESLNGNIECIKTDNSEILDYAWGDDEELEKAKKYNYNKRAAFWNLDDNTNTTIFNKAIQSIIQENINFDIMLWILITTLNGKEKNRNKENRNKYIRLIKIFMNNNVFTNKDAWYESQAKGQYMYYSKNIPYGIPQYYGKHYDENYGESSDDNYGNCYGGYKFETHYNEDEYKECKKIIDAILYINACIGNDFREYTEILNEIKKYIELLEDSTEIKKSKKILGDIIEIEEKILNSNSDNRCSLLKFQKETRGIKYIIENKLDGKFEFKNEEIEKLWFESLVRLEWPRRKYKNNNIYTFEPKVYIMLNNKYDKYFEVKSRGYEIYKGFKDKLEEKYELGGKIEIEKCFWEEEKIIDSKGKKIIFKLQDYESDKSTTYKIAKTKYQQNGNLEDWRDKRVINLSNGEICK